MQPDKKRNAFVMTGFVDMRKQINGLAKIVQDSNPKGVFPVRTTFSWARPGGS
jgi:hypothetical protein